MHKTLLYIKVVLFLTAFAGVSSSHATNADSQNFFAPSAFDSCVSAGDQTNTDDEKAIIPAVVFSYLKSSSSLVCLRPTISVVRSIVAIPSARAPPVNTFA